MKIEIDISLDDTLGCGQAHRWIKKNNVWEGVLGDRIVTVKQLSDGFECSGTTDRKMILDYFRSDDDLQMIRDECAGSDAYVSELIKCCPGLRLLRQEPWECTATYLLATNANVKRIAMMVDNVCREFGRDLGGRYSFPTPEEIIAGEDRISNCRLGFRANRFVELAHRVHDRDIDLDRIKKMDYCSCVSALQGIKGVGPKVADCIALFSMDHMEAFPIDARIEKIMKAKYGIEGSYRAVSEKARMMFGKYPGYAQEYLYHGDIIMA